jgi:hypothetical protein
VLAERALYTDRQNNNRKSARNSVAAPPGKETQMAILTRRSMLRTPLARGAAGTLSLQFDVMNDGMAPELSLDKPFKPPEAIFAKYPIVAS